MTSKAIASFSTASNTNGKHCTSDHQDRTNGKVTLSGPALDQSNNRLQTDMNAMPNAITDLSLKPAVSLTCNLSQPQPEQLANEVSSHLNTTNAAIALMPLGHDEREYSCGLCSLRPQWLQRFANKQTFLTIFCLTSVLQGMYFTYFVSVLTTIEKLYQIQSKTTGMIMSATEIGQIGGALLLTYYGGHGHRPKWIACGMLIFAFASILCSTPHYLFGNDVGTTLPPVRTDSNETVATLKLREHSSKLCYNSSSPISSSSSSSLSSFSSLPSLSSLSSSSSSSLSTSTSVSNLSSLEERRNSPNNRNVKTELNWSESELMPTKSRYESKCDHPETVNIKSRITNTVLSIFFVSLLLIGIGATAINTLGIPYIDDNVAPKESPLYFGITIGVRIFGPVCGFLLGSVCTSVYVEFPFGTSSLTPNDPQWIGAWWLGVFIVGIALALTSFPMMVFPRRLPQPDPSSYCHIQQQNNLLEQQRLLANGNDNKLGNESTDVTIDKQLKAQNEVALLKKAKKNGKPTLKDFPTAIKRLLKNDILLCRTASSVLHILPIAGLYTFLPKYLESQFQLTATKANMISGLAGIFIMGIGIFASGSFMRKYKPNARFVARWIALSALLYAMGMVILMFLGCPLNNFVGLNVESQNNVNSSLLTCSSECSCSSGEYSPICTSTGITYLSPCLAGCTSVNSSNNEYIYSNCKCLEPNVTAKNGSCPLECNNLVWYIIIFSLFVLIHSTSEVGSMLLTLRCVDPQDKAMALGLISFAIGLFGNVPCPIIYGAVVDSACLFWEGNCGKRGACRIYDPVKFRQVFHGVTAVIMFAAFIVDAIVWYKAPSIQFHEDTKPVNQSENTSDQQTKQNDSESVL